jgi:hypothetical protein
VKKERKKRKTVSPMELLTFRGGGSERGSKPNKERKEKETTKEYSSESARKLI